MGQKYWIGREQSALRMAEAAATSQARLAHYELAGLHSISAAQSLPAHPSELVALHTFDWRAKHLGTPTIYAKTAPPMPQQALELGRENARIDVAEPTRMGSSHDRPNYEHGAPN